MTRHKLSKRLLVLSAALTMLMSQSAFAGEVVELAGFGAWDGRYIIEGARHSVSGSGYVTSLSMRLAREKY